MDFAAAAGIGPALALHELAAFIGPADQLAGVFVCKSGICGNRFSNSLGLGHFP
jgi:hypothetical protein